MPVARSNLIRFHDLDGSPKRLGRSVFTPKTWIDQRQHSSFTTPLDRRRTGRWWKRELIGELSAAMTAAELRRFLRQGIQ